MALNTAMIKRGWVYDTINSVLYAGSGASSTIRFTIDGTDEIDITTSAIAPSTSDGTALGTTSLMWSDLFLASGGVINWNNGDVTLTHASNALAFAGGCFNMFTSGSPYSYTAGTPAFTLYATNAGTSGSTSAEPFYVYSALTGAGQVGGRSRFHTYTNVAAGGWVNALKSYMEFGSSGKNTGLASSMCAEMKMPNADTGTGGTYFPLEIEYVAGGTSTTTAGSLSGNHAGFIYMNSSGDADGDFDDNGFFFCVDGLTAGSGHVLSAASQTLKVGIGTTTRYLLMSVTQDKFDQDVALSSGAAEVHGFALDLTGTLASGGSTVAANITNTCAGTAGAWACGLFVKTIQAAKYVNGYLCAAEFELNSTAADASDNSVVVLNSTRNHTGSPPAADPYIMLREYGTTYANVFVRVFGDTGQGAINATNAATLVTQVADNYEQNANCAVRCMVGSTPVWLIASSTAPS